MPECGGASPIRFADALFHMKIEAVTNWRVAGLLLAMLIIVGLPYVVTLTNTRDTQLATTWVAHSNSVKAVTYQVAYVMRDSEAAAYRLLAGDGNDLTRTRASRAGSEVPPLLQQLRVMTIDNPDQQIQIGALESDINGAPDPDGPGHYHACRKPGFRLVPGSRCGMPVTCSRWTCRSAEVHRSERGQAAEGSPGGSSTAAADRSYRAEHYRAGATAVADHHRDHVRTADRPARRSRDPREPRSAAFATDPAGSA